MSRVDPYKAPYPTLTGEIGFQMRFIAGLVEQHNRIHKDSKPFLNRLMKLILDWEKLPYPKEVQNNNDALV